MTQERLASLDEWNPSPSNRHLLGMDLSELDDPSKLARLGINSSESTQTRLDQTMIRLVDAN